MPDDRLPRIGGVPGVPRDHPASAAQQALNEEIDAVNASDAAASLMQTAAATASSGNDPAVAIARVLAHGFEALRQELRAQRIAHTRGSDDLLAVFEEMGRS